VEKENHSENKVVPKDFFASMKEIEFLFVRASESGKEVPRMLEANKLHFRPIFPGKESNSYSSLFSICSTRKYEIFSISFVSHGSPL
jgi:hypothetical protein